MTNRVRTKGPGLLLAAALAVTASVCAQAEPGQTSLGQTPAVDPETVVAEIGDRQITLGEVERLWAELDGAAYRRMQQQLYDARREALEHLIGNLLIEEAARARGTTADALLAEERRRRLRPVTDQEVAVAFQSLQDRMPPGTTLEQAREPIRDFLEAQREEEVRESLLAELRGGRTVRVLLEPPRIGIETRADEPARGPERAPVEIVEYTDYQ